MPRPFRGQRIGVFKANLIIPQLRWAEKFISDGFEKDMEKSFIHILINVQYAANQLKSLKKTIQKFYGVQTLNVRANYLAN